MRAVWAAARIGAPLVLACACSPGSLGHGVDGGSGAGSVPAPSSMGAMTPVGDGGTGAVGGTGAAGGTGTGGPNRISCPAVEPVPSGAATGAPAARVPTATPFACDPLPAAYIFPPAAGRTPGLFSRCASFEVGAAQRLAVSPEGQFVALVPADGIVRVVDVTSRKVVAVLAPSRATVDLVAFAPDGRSILTLASGEREATLWQFGDPPVPMWTVRLPGHRHQLRFGGGALAFSPDGRTALVSAGQDASLIDVATGAVRVTRPPRGALMDAAYGWGGRRIVVAEGAPASHCAPGVHGGTVTILDAETLADVAQIADFGSWGNLHGAADVPTFRASPADDFVLAPASVFEPPAVRAFQLSDGAELPAPGLDALPLAFMADGEHLLWRANGQLSIAARDGGEIVASTANGGSGPVAVSSDGRIVAIGGVGATLLRVWNVADATPTPVCSAEDPAAPPYGNAPGVSLTADGQMIALGQGSRVRLVRTATGFSPANFALDDPDQVGRVMLSPNLRFLLAAPTTLGAPTVVFSLLDGNRVALLPAGGLWWTNFVFSPREDELYASGSGNDYQLYVARLDAPGLTSVQTLPSDTSLLGFAQGCPVLYEPSRGAWRSCGACTDPPVAGPGDGGAFPVLLSADGRLLAVRAPYPASNVTVWPMLPGGAPLRTFGPSAEDIALQPLLEVPIAISGGGGRIATSTIPAYNCYGGPGFAVRIHDLATGAVIDTLPPAPGYGGTGLAVDRDVHMLAYGAQLWCSDF